jgi:hypothetical protein
MIKFLRQAAEQNKINRKTAGSVWSAVSRILTSVHGDLTKVNVPELNVEATLAAFEQKEGSAIGAATMQSYKSRFHMAVRWYLAYLHDPATWTKAAPEPRNHELPMPADGFVDYPFPVRGATGHLILPRALTNGEADRVGAFVRTLVEEAM